MWAPASAWERKGGRDKSVAVLYMCRVFADATNGRLSRMPGHAPNTVSSQVVGMIPAALPSKVWRSDSMQHEQVPMFAPIVDSAQAWHSVAVAAENDEALNGGRSTLQHVPSISATGCRHCIMCIWQLADGGVGGAGGGGPGDGGPGEGGPGGPHCGTTVTEKAAGPVETLKCSSVH